MQRALFWLAAGLFWTAGLVGAISLQQLPSSIFPEHGVCGPWGCGAPVPALLACHSFWLMFIGPPTLIASRRLAPTTVKLLGRTLISSATLGLLAVGIWEATTWLPQAQAWQRNYFFERYLFALATLVDLPILETLFVGGALWLATSMPPRPRANSSGGAKGDRPTLAARPLLEEDTGSG